MQVVCGKKAGKQNQSQQKGKYVFGLHYHQHTHTKKIKHSVIIKQKPKRQGNALKPPRVIP